MISGRIRWKVKVVGQTLKIVFFSLSEKELRVEDQQGQDEV